MNFINKETIEILAIIILLLPVLIIDIFVYFKYKRSFFEKRFFIVFCLVNATIIQYILNVTTYFPYDNYLSFKNDKEIFKYYYPKSKIRKKYEYENDTFYIYENSEESGIVHFVKNKNKWQNVDDEKIMNRSFNDCGVSFHAIENTTNTRVFIQCHTNKDSKYSIEDSSSSKFERFSNKLKDWMQEGEYDIIYTTLLEDFSDKDYELIIDNKRYKLFK